MMGMKESEKSRFKEILERLPVEEVRGGVVAPGAGVQQGGRLPHPPPARHHGGPGGAGQAAAGARVGSSSLPTFPG